MSISNILLSPPASWLNPSFKSLNMSNGPISNVSTINGIPFIPEVADVNPVNIIFKPGSVSVEGSNIVQSWGQVVNKASKVNVNQCLNVYFDNSIDNCVINQNLSCNYRIVFTAYKNTFPPIEVQIEDGVQVTNLREISGPLILTSNSTTLNPLSFDSSGYIFKIKDGASLKLLAGGTISFIELDSSDLSIFLENLSSFDNSLNSSLSCINMLNSSNLTLNMTYGSSISNDALSGDLSSDLIIYYDSSINASFSLSDVLGSKTLLKTSNSLNISYNDSLTPPTISSTNVQGAIDALKSTYLPLSGGTTTGTLKTTQPHYFVNASGTQTVTAYNTSKLTIWNTLISSRDITYLSGTFTIHTTGVYLITYNFSQNSLTSDCIGAIEINNNFYGYTYSGSVLSQSTISSNGFTIAPLSNGDTFSIYAGNAGTGSVDSDYGTVVYTNTGTPTAFSCVAYVRVYMIG